MDFQIIDQPEFTQEEIDDALSRHGLLTFALELTKLCNYSCVYCYRETGIQPSNELSLDELFSASQQAIDLGARKAGIIGAGEPTLDKHLVPILEFLRGRIENVTIFTNGSGINAKLAKILYDLKIKVILKINSLDPLVHDTLVGKKGGYRLTMRGLDQLLNAGYPDANHRLIIESVVTKTNLDGLPELWCWCRERDFSPFFERLAPLGRATDGESLGVSPQQLFQLFNQLKHIDETRFGYKWTIQPPWSAQRCSRHFYNCHIDIEGNVLPCPGVDIPVGNIREKSLKDILASSQIINDLRHIDERIKGTCATCELKRQCYGCRGTAYHVTGDYLASDPLCWKFNSEQSI